MPFLQNEPLETPAQPAGSGAVRPLMEQSWLMPHAIGVIMPAFGQYDPIGQICCEDSVQQYLEDEREVKI